MAEFDLLASLPAIAPEIGLTVMAVVVLLLDSYLPAERSRNIAFVAAMGMAGLAITPFIWTPATTAASATWGGMIVYDPLAQIFKVMILLAGAITSLMAIDDSGVRGRGEFHLIIIIATLGGVLMAGANDLVMVFIALETLTIPLYVLAAFRRDDAKSSESGLKYFLFGSFTSAILLYAFSLLFGFTGTTSLPAMLDALMTGAASAHLLPILLAFLMVFVGFGFKLAVVPFHFWTPDVYEGAPTPVTAYISVASKAASFALLVRLMLEVFPSALIIDGQTVQVFISALIAVIAIVTMTFGNVMALRQSNIKRFLSYSSIAQAGYMLIGVAALQAEPFGQTFAVSSISFYLFMYTFTNLAAFAGIILFAEQGGSEQIADYAGLARRNPWLALTLTIALLSLAGIPPAAGFIGKFVLFQAGVEAGLVGLVLIGVVNAIISIYYYLVVIKVMYVDQAPSDAPVVMTRPYAWILGITALVVLILGVVPTPIINWAREGAQVVIHGGL